MSLHIYTFFGKRVFPVFLNLIYVKITGHWISCMVSFSHVWNHGCILEEVRTQGGEVLTPLPLLFRRVFWTFPKTLNFGAYYFGAIACPQNAPYFYRRGVFLALTKPLYYWMEIWYMKQSSKWCIGIRGLGQGRLLSWANLIFGEGSGSEQWL